MLFDVSLPPFPVAEPLAGLCANGISNNRGGSYIQCAIQTTPLKICPIRKMTSTINLLPEPLDRLAHRSEPVALPVRKSPQFRHMHKRTHARR